LVEQIRGERRELWRKNDVIKGVEDIITPPPVLQHRRSRATTLLFLLAIIGNLSGKRGSLGEDLKRVEDGSRGEQKTNSVDYVKATRRGGRPASGQSSKVFEKKKCREE